MCWYIVCAISHNETQSNKVILLFSAIMSELGGPHVGEKQFEDSVHVGEKQFQESARIIL